MTHDRELYIGLAPLVDVLHPLVVRVKVVGGEADDLDVALGEVGLAARDLGELSRAYGREVCWVAEQDCPAAFDELVEINVAMGGFGLEVRCYFL